MKRRSMIAAVGALLAGAVGVFKRRKPEYTQRQLKKDDWFDMAGNETVARVKDHKHPPGLLTNRILVIDNEIGMKEYFYATVKTCPPGRTLLVNGDGTRTIEVDTGWTNELGNQTCVA